MACLDKKRLVGEMAARYGIRMDESDPALAIISLNQLILEESIQNICEQLRARIAEFEASAQKLETRAGQVLANQVKESASEIRKQLREDTHAAGLGCRELLHQIHEAHQRPVLLRWAAIGIVFGFILFCCGVWVGRMTALGWSRAGF
ncbi:MAG: hypothetical protein ACR2JB_22990 [Bryobacteraceae bacterium]